MNQIEADIKILFDYLESHEFNAEINIYSDLKSAEKGIVSNNKVATLKKLCWENPLKISGEIIERVRNLVKIPVDPRYESPWDVALSAYLLVLQSIDYNLALLAANIVSKAPQTWWADKISNRLLTEERLSINSAYDIKELNRSTSSLYDSSASHSLIFLDITPNLEGRKLFKAKVNPRPKLYTGLMSTNNPCRNRRGPDNHQYIIKTYDSVSECEEICQ